MKLEIQEIDGILEEDQIVGSICTLFCSNNFLNYHRVKKPKPFKEYRVSGSLESGEIFSLALSLDISEGWKHFVSHAGAPFGGICVGNIGPGELSMLYDEIWKFLNRTFGNVGSLEIRIPPNFISSSVSSHEWALWSNGFSQKLGYLGRFLPPRESHKLRKDRVRNIVRNEKTDFTIHKFGSPTQEAYSLLQENRIRRFNVLPTHSLRDFQLIERFSPDSIITVQLENKSGIQAVAIIFKDQSSETLQYVANNLDTSKSGFQDTLLNHYLDEYRNMESPFLFGTSTEPTHNHRSLNSGLDNYKASWGGLPYSAFRYVKLNQQL